jgi:hypothetical protein
MDPDNKHPVIFDGKPVAFFQGRFGRMVVIGTW